MYNLRWKTPAACPVIGNPSSFSPFSLLKLLYTLCYYLLCAALIILALYALYSSLILGRTGIEDLLPKPLFTAVEIIRSNSNIRSLYYSWKYSSLLGHSDTLNDDTITVVTDQDLLRSTRIALPNDASL